MTGRARASTRSGALHCANDDSTSAPRRRNRSAAGWRRATSSSVSTVKDTPPRSSSRLETSYRESPAKVSRVISNRAGACGGGSTAARGSGEGAAITGELVAGMEKSLQLLRHAGQVASQLTDLIPGFVARRNGKVSAAPGLRSSGKVAETSAQPARHQPAEERADGQGNKQHDEHHQQEEHPV